MSKPLPHAEVINHMANPKQHCQAIGMQPLPDDMRKVMERNISELYDDDEVRHKHVTQLYVFAETRPVHKTNISKILRQYSHDNTQKNRSKKILRSHNKWRRGDSDLQMESPEILGQAIDALTAPNEMAQEIRDAAMHWPSFIGDVECGIIDNFATYQQIYGHDWRNDLAGWNGEIGKTQALTFLLFVAEALES